MAGITEVEPPRITVVESDACHFCEDAQEALSELAAEFEFNLETVDVRSDEGQRLMRVHRAAMSPLVLLDGAFFSNGRLPRRKLVRALSDRRDAAQSLAG